MEVSVWLEQYQHGVWQKLTNAVFLMAARNATNTSSAPVNKLVPANETEKQIWKEAEGTCIMDNYCMYTRHSVVYNCDHFYTLDLYKS